MTDRERNKFVLDYVRRSVQLGDYEVSGFRLLMRCPLPECRDARKAEHFYVNREWYGWRCYRQGVSGTLRHLVHANPGVWSPIRTLDDRGTARLETATKLPDDLVPLTEASDRIFPSFRRRAYEYALSRGISPAQIHDYRIAVKPYDLRLWFPFWTDDGKTVYRMGRLVEPCSNYSDAPKTWDEGVPEKPLFGSHVRKPSKFVVLVEGVFDHFVTPHSYALMGSTITPGQVETLWGWWYEGRIDRVFMLLDPDAKGKGKAEVLKLRKRDIPAANASVEGTDDDPGKFGASRMARLVQALAAVPASSLAARPFLRLDVPRSTFATP